MAVPILIATPDPEPGPRARLVFDQPSCTLGMPVRIRVQVDGLPGCPVTFRGAVRVGDTTVPAVGTTIITDDAEVVYGPIRAPGWQVIQDPDDPTRYTAIPD